MTSQSQEVLSTYHVQIAELPSLSVPKAERIAGIIATSESQWDGIDHH